MRNKYILTEYGDKYYIINKDGDEYADVGDEEYMDIDELLKEEGGKIVDPKNKY